MTRSRADGDAATTGQRELERQRGRPVAGATRERLVARIPVVERRLELAGVSTAVLEGGDGPPVVLLHGPGEFALTWMRVIPDLVMTHRVLAPDLPGHGASRVTDGRLDVDRVLTWIDELITRTCPSPPVLVGHLLGGAIAARFAIGRGDRLSRLVLVDSHGLSRLRPSPRFALTLIRYLAGPTERSQDRFFRQCFVDLDGLRERAGGVMAEMEAYALDRARAPGQKAALRALMPRLGVPRIPPAELARIAVPTTLIWGRRDRQVRLRVAEAASARHGWPLRVIENAADDPATEQPEAFLRALRTALGTA